MTLQMTALEEAEARRVVRRALREDIGPGDITTQATVPWEMRVSAAMVAKGAGVVAGLKIAYLVFAELDPYCDFEAHAGEGEPVQAGQMISELKGEARAMLTAERTALNFVQRMSGIATRTAEYVEAVRGTKARIVDTRKTAPGLRLLDKYAVRAGGGANHRFGLYDGVLIKDNHLRCAGGVTAAVRAARAAASHLLRIEVEAETLEQAQEALAAGADAVLLDNMALDTMRQAVELAAGRALVEASGGVTLETVRHIAECGVDLISVGELTHSAPALDISLEVEAG